jgi:branched-chain amino acid transport system ATP-binding protein
VVDLTGAGPEGGHRVQPILETRGLTKDFGGLRAVDGVDLVVQKGEIHSIIGPNGAGKTTLFNMLTGFLRPTEGSVHFEGREITHLPPHRISHLGIARTFQITSIFPDLTVLENVRIAAQSRSARNFNLMIDHRRLRDAAEVAGEVLEDMGLSHRARVAAKNLSYGEKRCLEMAIALATRPRLLLLDEPTSGMSPEESSMVVDLIHRVASKVTVILIEHNIDVVLAISHRITVMNQGRILAEGPPQQIQADERVQEAYLGGM